MPAVGVCAIGAHVAILLEVSDRLFLSSLDLANQLVGVHLCLSLLRVLGLVETIDLRNDLLVLYLTLVAYLYLEELHPADPSYRILR